MAYREEHRFFSFADLAVEKQADKYRALTPFKQLYQTIELYKCLLLLNQFYLHGLSNNEGVAMDRTCSLCLDYALIFDIRNDISMLA